MPVLQLVVRQVQLYDMCAESSDLSLVSGPVDPTAGQHQNAGQVQTVWRGGGGGRKKIKSKGWSDRGESSHRNKDIYFVMIKVALR